ncbi:DUF1194 domain-containing protein [Palleronia sp. LCG004]|uniref:DUF1194 domain-containing protein n=1 Tax=Palleronia sp. LCG004 TaxID=3079304 RepID=UPI002941E938|nr:DUF1194 domain-containing protein [Palleronia sp. LCG004]WOI57359.1 DUF1194 domain-containing protein [Palleronia sp. LCG004]
MGQHGKYRSLVSLAAALLAPGAVAAECRLALAIAIDISSSVDPTEDELQRHGLASALTSAEVVAAALSVPGAPVAVAIYEWSGRWQQILIADWTLIERAEDLDRVAGVVAGSARSHDDYPTAMGYALGYGEGLLRRAPECLFHTIDVAGDGMNNDGFGPRLTYQNFPFDGITVNGLVIAEDGPEIVEYYDSQVRYGPGSFVEIARGFEDFERAMRRKLEREMSILTIGSAEPAINRYSGSGRSSTVQPDEASR